MKDGNFTLKQILHIPIMIKSFDYSKDHQFLIVGDYYQNLYLYQYDGENYKTIQNFTFDNDTDTRQGFFTDDNQFLAILTEIGKVINFYISLMERFTNP